MQQARPASDWVPKTKLGKLVLKGDVTTLDDALSKRSEPRRPEGWDGSAAQRIVRALRIGSETADPGVTRPADRRASGNRAAGTA